MKKQILFLTFFTLALIFAGFNSSGQVLNTEEDYLTVAPSYCVPAVALDCGLGGALAPMPGVPYDYTITIGTGQTVHWFVTDDVNVMTAQETFTTTIDPGDATGDYLLVADITPVTGTYNNTANTSPTINLTWKSFDGSAPNNVLLVAYVIDVDGCTDNIEVYRIEPEYAFTLDLAGIQDDGASHADPFALDECVSPVQSATYDGANLTVDYGINYVYYTVNGANWQTSWQTSLTATSDNANSVVGAPQWAYPDAATTGGAWNASGTNVDASHLAYITDGLSVDGFVDNDGACIIVRVPVTHGTASENIADETINLIVNGEMVDPADGITYSGYPDLDDTSVGAACATDLTTDNLDYVITPRPDLTDITPNPFETKIPTGN